MGNLRDIGRHNLGLANYRYSRCDDCGTEYPHATGSNGRAYWLAVGGVETPGPMMNGRAIDFCPCNPRSPALPAQSV